MLSSTNIKIKTYISTYLFLSQLEIDIIDCSKKVTNKSNENKKLLLKKSNSFKI